MSGIVQSLLPSVDSILGIRDSIGAVLEPVYRIQRTWSGSQGVGDGSPTDVATLMQPSPGIKQFAHDVRLLEGGSVQQGDILLQGVSKNSFTEGQINGTSSAVNIENLFQIGTAPNQRLYTVVNVKENYLTWDILLRKRADQTRY